MKFNIAAAAIAGAAGGAIAVGSVGLLNMFIDGYGEPFLQLCASVYPGYKVTGMLGDLVIGCFYASVDGMIGLGGLALLYNLASCCGKRQ